MKLKREKLSNANFDNSKGMHNKNMGKIIRGCQGGITCGAIDEPRKSSKAIDKRIIINFRDEYVVIARFRDKNEVFILSLYIYIYIHSFIYISFINI